MAPRIRTRATAWAHPYRDPFTCYADGGDGGEPAPGPTDGAPVVEPEPDTEPAADEWTPPTREEHAEMVAKLQAASAEAANRRKFLKAHGIDPRTGQRIKAAEPAEPEPAEPQDPAQPGPSHADVKRQVEKAVAEARIEGMRGAKVLATRYLGALSDAGWNGSRLDLIMPLSDLDGADPTDPEDLAERVEHVKKLYPEGFQPARRTRNPANAANPAAGSGQNGAPAAKVDTADKPAPKAEPKDWADRLAQRALRLG